MAFPESFKFDVRVRERLLRKGEITEAEIEKNLEGLADAADKAVTIELKQPAFQTEAERAENAVVVRAAPPRPITLAAPINLDEEEEDEEPLPRRSVPPEKVERPAAVAERAPEPVAASEGEASDVEDDEDDDDDDDDDDESDDGEGAGSDEDKNESGADS